MEIKITEEKLYSLIKKAIKEVIEEEKINLILHHIPFVSDAEMDDIQNEYKKPSDENEIAYSENLEI